MPKLQNRPLGVFLCHTSQDKAAVRDLYLRLKAEGWIDPWLDEKKLGFGDRIRCPVYFFGVIKAKSHFFYRIIL
jgi:hypothetical protein